MRRKEGNHFPGNPLTGDPMMPAPPLYCPECGRKKPRLIGHEYNREWWPSLICRGWLSVLRLPYPFDDALAHYEFDLPVTPMPERPVRFDRLTGHRADR